MVIIDKRKFDIFIVTLCLILIIILGLLYCYLTKNPYITNLSVNSNRKISNNYDLGMDYYLVYEDIVAEFYSIRFFLNYIPSISFNIEFGRMIENNFEIIVSSKHRSLLNKKIKLVVDSEEYYFLVVGVYSDTMLIKEDYIFSNNSTMNILYENNSISNYNYIFNVNNYLKLNKSIDLLKYDGYGVSIENNSNWEKLDNYNTINDVILLFIIILFAIVLIYGFL